MDKFMIAISEMGTVEFLGLASVCKVKLYKDSDEKEPREFTDIFEDVLAAYKNSNRKMRRLFLKLARGGKKDAAST